MWAHSIIYPTLVPQVHDMAQVGTHSTHYHWRGLVAHLLSHHGLRWGGGKRAMKLAVVWWSWPWQQLWEEKGQNCKQYFFTWEWIHLCMDRRRNLFLAKPMVSRRDFSSPNIWWAKGILLRQMYQFLHRYNLGKCSFSYVCFLLIEKSLSQMNKFCLCEPDKTGSWSTI